MDIQILIDNAYSSLRSVFFTSINMLMFLGIMSQILERRHSYKYIAICFFFKVIVLNWLCLYVGYAYLLSDTRIMIAYMFTLVIYAVFLFYIQYYTFNAPFIKVMIISVLCELFVCGLGTVNTAICNFLAKEQELLLIVSRLSPVDILYPILSIIEWRILHKVVKPLSIRIKTWEIKYPKVWYIFFFTYLFIGFITMQVEFRMSLSTVVWGILIVFFILLLLSMFVGVFLYHSYRREVIRKHDFLRKQKEIVNSYTQNIYKQIHEIKHFSHMIDTQMEQLVKDDDFIFDKDRIESYLKQLKQQCDFIDTGVFCRDWMIDSVLCYMGNYFERNNIIYHFYFQNYHRGEIQIDDLSEIIFQMLHLPIDDEVVLKCNSFKNLLIFELCGTRAKQKTLRKALSPVLNKYEGSIWKDKNKKNTFIIQLMNNI